MRLVWCHSQRSGLDRKPEIPLCCPLYLSTEEALCEQGCDSLKTRGAEGEEFRPQPPKGQVLGNREAFSSRSALWRRQLTQGGRPPACIRPGEPGSGGIARRGRGREHARQGPAGGGPVARHASPTGDVFTLCKPVCPVAVRMQHPHR